MLGSEVIQTMATLMLALIMYKFIVPNIPMMASAKRHDVHHGTESSGKYVNHKNGPGELPFDIGDDACYVH